MCRFLFILLLCLPGWVAAQDHVPTADRLPVWLAMQAVPSIAWTSFPSSTHFAFEWEATPLLYSWGMDRHVSPWKSFIILPPARFTGSIEVNASVLVYTTNPGTTRLGYSAQMVMHLPVMEHGEYMGLNVGGAVYNLDDHASMFVIAGVSSFFGLLHYNIKYAPTDGIWMNSIEVRLF
jgi:hypothetical protein